MISRFPSVSATLVLLGCALADEAGAATVGVVMDPAPFDRAGPTLSNGLRQAPDAPVRQVREVLRHGDGVDVPDWAAFVRPPALKLDPSGRLYVLPRGGDDPRVRLLDEEGNFVRYVARRGDGPGEFPYIGSMGFAGDTLWHVVDPDGRVESVCTLPPGCPSRRRAETRVWGVGKGHLDTPYIVMYELHQSSR